MRSLRSLLRHLADHPALLGNCLLCHQAVQHHPLLCDECQAELPKIEHPCPRCGFPLSETAQRCGQCLQQPPTWDRLCVLADYQAPYLQLIQQLKYAGNPECASLLGRLFCDTWLATRAILRDPQPEILLPVPLHRWRRWRRGYNQAEELARAIGHGLQIPVDSQALRRTRATPPQARLHKHQRQKNLQNAFFIPQLPYRHVALIDDVVTTGATAEQLTHALRQAGVEVVEVWAICRTLRHASRD